MNTIPDRSEEFRALQDTLYFIGGKWRLPIISSLCNGNKRFKDIQRSIPGITTRMLSKELKDMELNKLIKRTVNDDSHILITYEPTSYSRTFGKIIQAMIDWGREHREVITEREIAKKV